MFNDERRDISSFSLIETFIQLKVYIMFMFNLSNVTYIVIYRSAIFDKQIYTFFCMPISTVYLIDTITHVFPHLMPPKIFNKQFRLDHN